MSEKGGISVKDLAWINRIIYKAIVDALNQELEALKDTGIPKIDAFIEWDESLVYTLWDKKIDEIATMLIKDMPERYKVEYEMAYLRKRQPLRFRLQDWKIEDETIKATEEAGEGGER